MSDQFYCAFEDRFRGSRELIKSRLRVYLPFIAPLRDTAASIGAVDLGCGRGEWLELLRENGFDGRGVDIDETMLGRCRDRGLVALNRDALSYLREQASESLLVVSAIHLVEHIPFTDLRILVSEALRVLAPGGILILETPNPENLTVGASGFYLDPTHQKPIPAQLLAFVVESAGFERTKVLRLQEPYGHTSNTAPSLIDVLQGVSPDYAVVAQKRGAPALLASVTSAFDREYGISLEVLANKFQQEIERQLTQLREILAETEASNRLARARETESASRIQVLLEVAHQTQLIAQQAESRYIQLQERAGNTAGQLAKAVESRLEAEVRARELEVRAMADAARATAAEERASAAALQAAEANGRALSAEARSAEVTQQSEVATVRAQEADHHAKAAEARLAEAEQRAISAENQLALISRSLWFRIIAPFVNSESRRDLP